MLIGLETKTKMKVLTMNDIFKAEYSDAFDEKRKHLIEQSYYKYGPARRNFATGNVDAVMDGAIDPFINAYLKWINTKPEQNQ